MLTMSRLRDAGVAAALALLSLSGHPADGGEGAHGDGAAPRRQSDPGLQIDSVREIDAGRQIDRARRDELIRMVRHDCGSCHGLSLAGGLGPALTASALAHKPVEYVQAIILLGRAGTAMPPWRGLLQDDEARWIAQALKAGFPAER